MRFEPRGGLRSRIRAGRGRTRFVGDGHVLWPVAHAQCGEQARDAALQRAVQDDRLALGPGVVRTRPDESEHLAFAGRDPRWFPHRT